MPVVMGSSGLAEPVPFPLGFSISFEVVYEVAEAAAIPHFRS